MVIGIVENLRGSYDYANKALHSFSDWIILITISLLMLAGIALMVFGLMGFVVTSIETIVPGASAAIPESIPFAGLAGAFSLAALLVGAVLTLIFSILWTGFILRVYRGGELKLGAWGSMFLDGLLATIISLVYFIPYIVISVLLMFGPMDNAAFVLAAMVIRLVVLLITSMVLIMALIRFAKEQRVGAAFQIKELLNVIATIGWLRYLGNIIVIGLVLLVIYAILLVILVVGWVLLIVVAPLLAIWEAKFYANLYESAVAASTPAAVEE
ncbi:DUF4013 domain-containing protein [Methanocorpusculum vombati]|uniref:DUF4013 domain-containing protein n=1 Tax=Methanocorpusculum vombati TaxID=3002864 RepID=A0ABT4IKC1_9EURY|nr:DUF4013 domain-containing protein [Methanocorpusculum vombati]MCZ9320130.1 DUF4013 domain-containing protein [Methanocorpusculum sp.]MCZ0862191.1 DUF4013 domain-containing protein [Methanocorpusculum vombati]MDE2519669.1 DUF4013 domain-containing protein [Methanocorpusculum sp.]MDE2533480.1 DUF4013 domain-containing protein [Methanocorpusculum sp.]MDE2546342.1 DUF4013 domain-containing protein [Methanocorpusculum sp.]